MWPILVVVSRPEHTHSASRVCRSDEGGRLRVGSTGHSLVRSTLNGTGSANLADGRAWDRLPSGQGTLVRLSIDGDLLDNTVGPGEGEKHEDNKGESGEKGS